MIVIYDFDGTLTPFSLAQYQVLKQCKYTNKKLMMRIAKEMAIYRNKDFYETYYECYRKILSENGIPLSKDTICMGAQDVKFNRGVKNYFNRVQRAKTGIKHYIVTSGIKDYIEETPIRKFIDGVYGVTFKEKNGIYTDISILLSDKKKVDAIKQIRKQNKGTKQIIYFGDGLTDKFAFEYVHSIGGKTVFIATNERAQTNYQKLNRKGIIDKYFKANFCKGSSISKFIQQQIELEKEEVSK